VVNNFISLRKMQVVGWLYLITLVIGSWVFGSWNFAWSALAGGVTAITSFWVSQRDLNAFLHTLGSGPALSDGQAKAVFSKSGFLIRFWIRIAIIGVVVLLLIKYSSINAFGLILGLSTIVFTVTFTAVEIVRRYYFSGRR